MGDTYLSFNAMCDNDLSFVNSATAWKMSVLFLPPFVCLFVCLFCPFVRLLNNSEIVDDFH